MYILQKYIINSAEIHGIMQNLLQNILCSVWGFFVGKKIIAKIVIYTSVIIYVIAVWMCSHLRRALILNIILTAALFNVSLFFTGALLVTPSISYNVNSNNNPDKKLYFMQESDSDFIIDNYSAEGIVKSIVQKDNYVQVVLKNVKIDDYSYSLLGNVNTCKAECGDKVRVYGKISPFDEPHNEGEFDSRAYYRSIGIDYKISIKNMEIIQKSKDDFLSEIQYVKKRFTYVYTQIADKIDAGIYISMALGDKSSLDADVKEMYQKNGIAHLLAISGLHISLIGMLLYGILRRAGFRFMEAATVSVVIIICYGLMTGNGISACRAVIMYSIILAGGVLGRTYDILSAIGAAVLFLVTDNAWVITNSGFMLSFGALTGIAVLYPAMEYLININEISSKTALTISSIIYRIIMKSEYFKKMSYKYKIGIGGKLSVKQTDKIAAGIKYILSAFLASLSVSLVTLPVVLYNYFQFPLYSIVLNMIVIPIMSVLMICVVGSGLAGLVSIKAGIFTAGMAHYILKMYEYLCNRVQKLPGAVIVTGRPKEWQIMVYVLLMLAGMVLIYILIYVDHAKYKNITNAQNKNNSKAVLIIDKVIKINVKGVVALLMFMGIMLIFYNTNTGFEVDVLDVGQGDGIFLRTDSNTVYMFDGGSTDVKNVGKYRIIPFLKSKGTTVIDYALVSHSDADHCNGIIEIIDSMSNLSNGEKGEVRINNLVLPNINNAEADKNYMNMVNKALAAGIKVLYVNAKDTFADKETSVQCLHPVANYEYSDANDYSAVYKISYRNFSMLMMGDAGQKAEQSILANKSLDDKIFKNISVLKAGHHGSDTSSSVEFIKKVNPKATVISCGINNTYGHPSLRVIESFNDIGCIIYQTTESGQIQFNLYERYIKVKKFKTNT